MLTSELKAKFFTEFDEFQSDYISPTKLNNFFWHAQNDIINNNLIPSYQSSRVITESLLQLKKTITINPTSSIINLTTDVINYNSLISVKPTYVVNQNVYSKEALLLLDVDKNNVYASGTYRYPKYEQYSDASNNTMLILYPIDTPQSVTIGYFRNILGIDFNNPTDVIDYDDNLISLILNKALQLAAAAFRDGEYFNTSSALLNQEQTPTN